MVEMPKNVGNIFGPVLEARSRIYIGGFTRKFDLIRSAPFVARHTQAARLRLTKAVMPFAVQIALQHMVYKRGVIIQVSFQSKNTYINATIAGQIIFINFIVMMYLTLRFSKGKADNLTLVGFYTFLLSFIFFPASLFYCWYWSRKQKKVVNKL